MNYKRIITNKTNLLDDVFTFKDRTFGVKKFNTTSALLSNWEDSMYELCSDYQYEDKGGSRWDYYLLMACSFNSNDLDERDRFEIENDRFGCRKILLFNSKGKIKPESLMRQVLPHIESDKKIKLITSEVVINDLDLGRFEQMEDYLTREMNDSEMDSFLNGLKLDANNED